MDLIDYQHFFESNPSFEAGDEAVEEIEYMFLLKLDDFAQLEKAMRKEYQEQWSVVIRGHGMESIIRVRQCIEGSDESFTVTNKVDFYDEDGKWEIEKPGERKHFEKIREMADSGMIKDRYFFPVKNSALIWEIDVFKDKDGKPYPWVKVDLEVPRRLEELPEFPITYTESFLKQREERNEEESQWVADLFTKHFVARRD